METIVRKKQGNEAEGRYQLIFLLNKPTRLNKQSINSIIVRDWQVGDWPRIRQNIVLNNKLRAHPFIEATMLTDYTKFSPSTQKLTYTSFVGLSAHSLSHIISSSRVPWTTHAEYPSIIIRSWGVSSLCERLGYIKELPLCVQLSSTDQCRCHYSYFQLTHCCL